MEREKSLTKSLFGDMFSPTGFSDFLDLKKQSLFDFKGFVDKGSKYELNLELPIVGDSISVEVEDNNLTVKYNEKKEGFSSQGSYTYSLPDDIVISTLNAKLGVVNENTLTITVDKAKKSKKEIKINIK